MANTKTMKTFEALNISSKYAICGLPIRVDTYKTCSFGCKYCFSNNRKIMKFEKELSVANLSGVSRRLERIKNGKFKADNMLDVLISQDYTWHLGGMSDPFQPVEKKLRITKGLLDITNKYNVHILCSTKADTVYDADIRPDLHTFQLSVSNVADRRDLEPNVPTIEKRCEFYKDLKKEGFKVGIRIQPFIPDISNMEIIELFHDADQITIEGIKLVPQNKEHKEEVMRLCNLKSSDFTQMGLLKRIRKGLWAIAESDLFYVCYEETEKGVAVGMLQKNSLSILGCPPNAPCEKYKSGIRDALLDHVYEVEEYAPEGQNKNTEESFASENNGQRDPTLL